MRGIRGLGDPPVGDDGREEAPGVLDGALLGGVVEADDADGGFAATASDPDNGDAVFKDVLLDQVDQFTNGKLKWELADAVHADVEGMSDADTDADLPDMPDEGYEEIVFTVVDVDADAADGYQAMPELDANALDTVSAIDDVDDLEDFDG